MAATSAQHYLVHQVARPELRIELRLVRAAQAGSRAAQDILVKSHQRFITVIALKYRGASFDVADLVAAGNLGFLMGIEKFNTDSGLRLMSYAVWWVRKAILDLLYNDEVAHVPRNILDKDAKAYAKTKRVMAKLQGRLADMPVDYLLGTEVDAALAYARPVTGECSVDVFNDAEETDYLPPALHVEPVELGEHTWITKLAEEVLDARSYDVVRWYYGIGLSIGLTLDEIAGRLKLSRERVRQILNAARKKLRQAAILKDVRA